MEHVILGEPKSRGASSGGMPRERHVPALHLLKTEAARCPNFPYPALPHLLAAEALEDPHPHEPLVGHPRSSATALISCTLENSMRNVRFCFRSHTRSRMLREICNRAGRVDRRQSPALCDSKKARSCSSERNAGVCMLGWRGLATVLVMVARCYRQPVGKAMASAKGPHTSEREFDLE